MKVRHDRGLGHERRIYKRWISQVPNDLRKGAVFFDYNDDMIAFWDPARGGALCEGKTTRKNSCQEKEDHPKAAKLYKVGSHSVLIFCEEAALRNRPRVPASTIENMVTMSSGQSSGATKSPGASYVSLQPGSQVILDLNEATAGSLGFERWHFNERASAPT